MCVYMCICVYVECEWKRFRKHILPITRVIIVALIFLSIFKFARNVPYYFNDVGPSAHLSREGGRAVLRLTEAKPSAK